MSISPSQLPLAKSPKCPPGSAPPSSRGRSTVDGESERTRDQFQPPAAEAPSSRKPSKTLGTCEPTAKAHCRGGAGVSAREGPPLELHFTVTIKPFTPVSNLAGTCCPASCFREETTGKQNFHMLPVPHHSPCLPCEPCPTPALVPSLLHPLLLPLYWVIQLA